MLKKPRKKRCKVCNKQFSPYNSLQKVCGVDCSIKYAENKRKEDLDNVKKWTKEKKERDRLPTSLKQTKLVVHEYIRLRDVGKECISCGTPYKSDFDAGHFYSANKFTALKFDLDNISGQCIQCNRFKEGEFEMYSLNLPNRIGKERYDALVKRAELSKKFTKKWTLFELSEIRKNVKELTKQLKNERS